MRISDLFVRDQTQSQSLNTENSTRQIQSTQQTQISDQTLRAELQPGKIVSGEIITGENGETQIKLLNDLLIGAKLDQNIELETGKTFQFQVRSNGQSLVLTPLQTNLSVEGPVLKALDMAGLPVNSATGELTKLMMQAGLPIDKNSLQHIYKEMISHPQGEISDLVDLHRLGMKVSDENLTQISSYKNLTHQLSEGLTQCFSQIEESISDMQSKGQYQEAGRLLSDIASAILESDADGQEQINSEGNISENTIKTAADNLRAALGGEETSNHIAEDQNNPAIKPQHTQQTGIQSSTQSGIQASTQNGIQTSLQISEATKESAQTAIHTFLANEEIPSEEKLKVITELLKEGSKTGNEALLKNLTDSPEIKKFLGNEFEKKTMIDLEKAFDHKELENLYSKLAGRLRGLEQALESNGQTQSGAYAAVQNMNQNLDFLNQINQMYTYVQLPLHLQQGQANGDLYVYANKKNLAQKDGPITALLHLDMEHLGPVDVYVSMQSEKVNTKFSVRDEEMLDFLEEHMHILTERLEKRGYQLTVQTGLKNDGEQVNSGIAPVLAQTSPGIMLQQRGFDMRT